MEGIVGTPGMEYGTDLDMNRPSKPPAADAETLRPRLLALAYRMLGSVADAEDAVQDAYLRLQQAAEVSSPDAWLVKATTRICIDRLRLARRRKEYVGPWLPEPTTEDWDGAAIDRPELAESLSMAFLVLLETLSPAERAAYLLREVFDYEFEEIATLLDKTPVNVRQIAARARKRLGEKERRFRAATAEADDLAVRFFDACRSGDIEAIEALLTPDVVYYSDGGGKAHAAPKPIHGTRRVAKLLAVVHRKRRRYCDISMTTVNGQPGVVFAEAAKVIQITTFASEQGRVTTLYTVLNPDKLRRWPSEEGHEHSDGPTKPGS
jgi:RNA polymerase sigma-70 factor (ECF subfamily)